MESAESTLNYEETILAQHSNARLRKRELNRQAKKDHLASIKIVGADAEKILNDLYPTKDISPDAELTAPSK